MRLGFQMLEDVRYALRILGRTPTLTAIIVLTLALGIGANTAIFSLTNAVLLRPPDGVADSARLVEIYTSDYSGPRFGASSHPDYRDFAAGTPELAGLAAFEGSEPLDVATGSRGLRAFGEFVSGNYFDVLGVTPALGRTLRAQDAAADAAPAVVIGYGLWQRAFGGAADVVGRTIRVRGQPVTIVGVGPRGFIGTQTAIGVDLWASFATQTVLDPSSADGLEDRASRGLFLVGRLARGATAGAAQTRLDVLAARLQAAYPKAWTDVRHARRRITVLQQRGGHVLPEIRSAVVSFIGLLTTVAALVLAICCANVANLLLARLTGRAREIAVRLAMGASRARVVRQLLTECTLLASLGGAAGVLLAATAGAWLARLRLPIPVPVVLDASPDARVLAFAGVVAVLTGIGIGVLPALRATRPAAVTGFRRDGLMPHGARRRFTLRNTLVASQVAVSAVLLVVAGLFLQSLERAQSVDLGFRRARVVLATLDLESEGYTAERAGRVYAGLEARVRALPGVASAAIARYAPLGVIYPRRGVRIDGYEPAAGEDMEVGVNAVDEDYFATLGIEILRGRAFTVRDRQGARPVAIVSEAFVRRYWPDGKVLGRRLDFGGGPAEVVGVAADAKYRTIADEALPYLYVSLRQNPAASAVLEVRTKGEPSALFPALRAQLTAVAPDLPVQLESMREHLGVSILPQRAGSILLGAFGGLGTLLAALGLYGVLTYLVAGRTREIGVRMALGSEAGSVIRMVLGQAAWLTAAGLVIGLVGAFAAARLAAGFLFGVAAGDPATYATVAVVIALVGLAAGFGPARRATRIEPSEALRHE